jgi:hypothetical protein
MSQRIRCENPACRCLFVPNPHVKNQRYCNNRDCQRLRKRLWQREKMKTDPDYRLDHRDSQQNWIKENPDYWRQYRSQHPEYVARNRLLQRERDKRRRSRNLAKMDASKQTSFVKPGTYYLFPARADLAKMDPSSHKYLLIPSSYPFLAKMDSVDSSAFSP